MSLASASLSKHQKAERKCSRLGIAGSYCKTKKQGRFCRRQTLQYQYRRWAEGVKVHLTLASTSAASGARVLSPAKVDTTWPATSATHTPLTSLLDR
jgi:hypothetical protein